MKQPRERAGPALVFLLATCVCAQQLKAPAGGTLKDGISVLPGRWGDVLRYIDLLQGVDLVMKHGERVN